MQVDYIYRMVGSDQMLTAIQKLDSESGDLLIGLAAVRLVPDNGKDEWYVYIRLQDPQPEDKARVCLPLRLFGYATALSYEDLCRNPRLGCICSGTYGQILVGFSAHLRTA